MNYPTEFDEWLQTVNFDSSLPLFDLRSITASSSSSPGQVAPEQDHLFNPQPQQPQPIQQHQPRQPSQPLRSILPRPPRSFAGQSRFSVQPQQPQINTQINTHNQQHQHQHQQQQQQQQSSPWSNDRLPPPPPPASAVPNTGAFFHVSATTNADSTSQGSEPTREKHRQKRKRIPSKKTAIQESATISEESDEDEPGITVGIGGGGQGDPTGRRRGACSHCKRLKMRCSVPPGEDTCSRCKSGGHICIVEGRRPRTAPNKREYLLAQIRQKDAIIESLLKQLHNPYIATPLSIASYRMATSPSDQTNKNVLAWLDRLQSGVRDQGPPNVTQAFLEPRKPDVDDESDTDSDGKRMLLLSQTDRKPGGPNYGDHDDGDGRLDFSDGETVHATALPDSTVPIGLIANLSLSNKQKKKKKKNDKKRGGGTSTATGRKDSKGGGITKDEAAILEDELNDDSIGVANERYFMPGPATDLGIRASLIEQHSPPEILVHGLVKPDDVDKLFQIFYERINPFISLLDPVLHTPASTFTRCPFLFTVVCAICSRFYSEKSEIYPIAMHFAKHSAASALTDGWKSVELCQAYILMSIFAVPARRWEEDRSWLYTGLAIRIATDLNLHQISNEKPQSEMQEREILNRRRVWLICFNLDRSTATQFGKPSTIKEDYLVRNSREWYKKSRFNHPYDIHLCAYTALLRIVKRFHDAIFSDPTEPTGLNKNIDFKTVTLAHDAQLTAYHEEWSRRFQEDSDSRDSGCVFRCTLLPFLVAYSRLVMFSFGFQQAVRRGFRDSDPLFFNTCLYAAKTVVRSMIDGLAPSGYMRFAPDGHFVFASFASAFMLKLLQPEFSSFLAKEQETEILDLIGRLIQTLSSPKIAIDDRHTPKLYARFLAGLLSRHRRDGVGQVGRSQMNPPPSERVSTSAAAGKAAPTTTTTATTTTTTTSGQLPQPTTASSSSRGFGAQMETGGGGAQMSQGNANPSLMTIQSTMHGSNMLPTLTSSMEEDTMTTTIPFSLEDFDMTALEVISEAEMLATMQAIKNPAWWSTGLMPGFSWPEGSPSPRSDLSPPSASMSIPPPFHHHHHNHHHQNTSSDHMAIPSAPPGLHAPLWNVFQGTTVV